jgi:hypothetical protein
MVPLSLAVLDHAAKSEDGRRHGQSGWSILL